MEGKPSKLNPSLIGGLIIGFLSSIPIINLGNCLCCMWVLLGGFVGAYLYKRRLPADAVLTSGDAALVGLLAGVFGALFGTFLNYFFMVVGGINPGEGILQRVMENRSDLSPEVEELLQSLEGSEGLNPLFVLVILGVSLIGDSVFGTLGGLLGSALLNKKSSTETEKTPK